MLHEFSFRVYVRDSGLDHEFAHGRRKSDLYSRLIHGQERTEEQVTDYHSFHCSRLNSRQQRRLCL